MPPPPGDEELNRESRPNGEESEWNADMPRRMEEENGDAWSSSMLDLIDPFRPSTASLSSPTASEDGGAFLRPETRASVWSSSARP